MSRNHYLRLVGLFGNPATCFPDDRASIFRIKAEVEVATFQFLEGWHNPVVSKYSVDVLGLVFQAKPSAPG